MGKQRTSSSVAVAAGTDPEALLGIEEPEINGYLNTKKEMVYKNIIWEMMNKDYAKANTPKKPNNGNKEKKKKDATNKRVALEKLENEKKRKKLSSKVNLVVLEKLMNDRDQPESEREPEKSAVVETQSCGEGEGGDDELEQYENEYNEDVDYENEYNYEEDYDYEAY